VNKKFIRYSDLDNWWNLEKTMSLYARDFELGRTRTWLITEKIDGYNVCISNLYKEGPAVFSRNGNQLQPGHQAIIKSYDWKRFFEFYPHIDFAYGEFAGPGIQNRVKYEEEKKLYLFDIFDKDGNFDPNFNRPAYSKPEGFDYSPVFYDIMGPYERIKELCIKSIEGGMLSILNQEEGNTLEGLVVRCVSTPMLTSETRFVYKVKHEKFEEKNRGEKKNKLADVDFSPVEPYVNENRAISAMSKFPGYKKHQIGDVMREIVEDVKKEMKKDGVKWDKVYTKFINKNCSQFVVRGAA
jgi:hypothetical protein